MKPARLLPFLLAAACGCFNGLLIKPVNTNEPLSEQTVQESEGWTLNKVAIIDVSGMILNARTSGLLSDGENPVSLFREKLEKAADDRDVKAVVLRINSPGGAVTASDIMYRDLLAFRARTQKPVVACLMDVAASGGYYLAVGCDHIVAHPTTVTGSIGVIMSLYNAEGLFTKLGLESNPIKSGANKDLGNPARKMTDEERAILQKMVDEMYEQFVTVVARGRPIPIETVRKLADGRVYTAREAHEQKLVDELGYLEDAIRHAKARAGIRDATVVAYDREEGSRGTIYAGMPTIPSKIAVQLQVPGLEALGLPPHAGATFLYLWQPGLR
jgi:protease-4